MAEAKSLCSCLPLVLFSLFFSSSRSLDPRKTETMCYFARERKKKVQSVLDLRELSRGAKFGSIKLKLGPVRH